MTFHMPEKYRIRSGKLATDSSHGNNGAFMIPAKRHQNLRAIATDNDLWEHVSVSLMDRCPTWDEMCLVKDMFWDEEDCVTQYHPPKSLYVSHHPYCLHMWRPVGTRIIMPPSWMVGPRPGQTEADCADEALRQSTGNGIG